MLCPTVRQKLGSHALQRLEEHTLGTLSLSLHEDLGSKLTVQRHSKLCGMGVGYLVN